MTYYTQLDNPAGCKVMEKETRSWGLYIGVQTLIRIYCEASPHCCRSPVFEGESINSIFLSTINLILCVSAVLRQEKCCVRRCRSWARCRVKGRDVDTGRHLKRHYIMYLYGWSVSLRISITVHDFISCLTWTDGNLTFKFHTRDKRLKKIMASLDKEDWALQ